MHMIQMTIYKIKFHIILKRYINLHKPGCFHTKVVELSWAGASL